jgi:cytochrome P450
MSAQQKVLTINNLPSPKGQPFLGNLKEFKVENKHQVLAKWSNECGELFKISLAGKKFIVSTNPVFNGKVLKNRPQQFKRFSKINDVFTELGISGVFNAEGDDWQHHRKIAAEALNAKNVASYFPIVQAKTSNLIQKFKTYADQENTIAAQKEFMSYTIDITTEIAFGYELDTINGKATEFQTHLEKVFPAINKRITSPFPLWKYIKSKADKELEHGLEHIQDVIYSFIESSEQRIKEEPQLKENPSNFLEALLVESSQENFTKQEVFGNVFTMLLAGEDTTSNSIAWAIYYLAQHPEWIQKLREEAIAVYPNDEVVVSNNMIDQLSLANAVAQEAIRLKPTTPQLFMQANDTIQIDNLQIEKDQVVILQNMEAQISDQYFKAANEFKPERWLKAKCPYHETHSPQYIKAFGGGPRYCPGAKLAMNEMTVCLSSICKQFDIELNVPLDEIKEAFAFTMHPDNLKIQLKRI